VARAIISPSFLLNVGVSNDAISLPYIQSRADLSELMAGSRSYARFCGTRCRLRSDPMLFAAWRTRRGRKRCSWSAGIAPLIDLDAVRNNHLRIIVLACAAVNGLISQSDTPAVIPIQPIRARPLLVAGWRGTGQCRRYEGDHAELWPERVGLSHKRDPPH
jgi:hypothetical protein